MSDDAHAHLCALLTRLKLTAMRERLDCLLEEAAWRELNLREALCYLCEAEVAHKEQRRIDMAERIAHFPFLRSLSDFDFSAQPSVDPAQVRALATARLRGQRRLRPAAGAARRRQDAPGGGARACSHRPRLLGAVQQCRGADDQPGESPQRRPAGGAPRRLPQAQAADRRRVGP